MSFNKTARIGEPDEELLNAIHNAQCVQVNPDFYSLFSSDDNTTGPLHPDKRPDGHKVLCLAPTYN